MDSGGGRLLYFDVRHGGTFGIGERIKGVVLQREPVERWPEPPFKL